MFKLLNSKIFLFTIIEKLLHFVAILICSLFFPWKKINESHFVMFGNTIQQKAFHKKFITINFDA